MVLFNLYLVLNDETVKVFDKAIQRIVYEGSSNDIPIELMYELVHDVTAVYRKGTNKPYFLINLN